MKITPLFVVLFFVLLTVAQAAKPITWNIWPDKAPGERYILSEEFDRTTPEDKRVADKRLIRLHNVSVPTVTIYKTVIPFCYPNKK